MSKTILILALAAIGAGMLFHQLQPKKVANSGISAELASAFNDFSLKYSKVYSSPADRTYRLKIFAQNSEIVKSHNKDDKKSFTMGLNKFADLTREEYSALLNAKSPVTTVKPSKGFPESAPNAANNLGQSANIDWRRYLQQSSITSSTGCNDNYAWVAAVAHNANYYISRGSLVQYMFSPQTYIDCSGNFGNYGCNGGFAANCFDYSKQWGANTMNDYPYYGVQRPCTAQTGNFRNRDTFRVPALSNTILYSSLANKNIITSAMDMASAQFYTGGIFTGPCTTQVNHNVLVVGAGTDPSYNKDYWLIMNTWGSTWGEQGYMRLWRFKADGDATYSSCGLNMYASYPTF